MALQASVDNVHVDVLVDSSSCLGEGQTHHNFLCSSKSISRLGKVLAKVALESSIAEDLSKKLLGVYRAAVLPVLAEALRSIASARPESASLSSHLFGRLTISVVLFALGVIAENLKSDDF